MIETLNQFALSSLMDSFETMAFMSPLPADAPHQAPADAVLLSMWFASNSSGIVEIVAPRNLGKVAASNMLGADPGAASLYDDALKELLNIFSGLMLRRWSSTSKETVEISLPALSDFSADADWQEFIASPGSTVLDVEGNLIALRVRAFSISRV